MLPACVIRSSFLRISLESRYDSSMPPTDASLSSVDEYAHRLPTVHHNAMYRNVGLTGYYQYVLNAEPRLRASMTVPNAILNLVSPVSCRVSYEPLLRPSLRPV